MSTDGARYSGLPSKGIAASIEIMARLGMSLLLLSTSDMLSNYYLFGKRSTIAKKPKGFVIECIIAECMDYEETYYGELFVKTLEGIVGKYGICVDLNMVPYIPDPGGTGNNVTDGITPDAFAGFYNKAKEHAELGRKALNETDAEKATELWRKIFKNRFPRTEASRSESLLERPVRPSSLTFPNRPVTPNKPKGFA